MTVIVGDVEFDLDIEAAKQAGFLKKVKQTRPVKMTDIDNNIVFCYSIDNKEYVFVMLNKKAEDNTQALCISGNDGLPAKIYINPTIEYTNLKYFDWAKNEWVTEVPKKKV